MSKLTRRLLHGNDKARTQRGATSVEYALMVAMIALVIIPAVIAFGAVVATLFEVDFPPFP